MLGEALWVELRVGQHSRLRPRRGRLGLARGRERHERLRAEEAARIGDDAVKAPRRVIRAHVEADMPHDWQREHRAQQIRRVERFCQLVVVLQIEEERGVDVRDGGREIVRREEEGIALVDAAAREIAVFFAQLAHARLELGVRFYSRRRQDGLRPVEMNNLRAAGQAGRARKGVEYGADRLRLRV